MNSDAARRSIALVQWCNPTDRASSSFTRRRGITVALQLDKTTQPVSQFSFKVRTAHPATGESERILKLDHEP